MQESSGGLGAGGPGKAKRPAGRGGKRPAPQRMAAAEAPAPQAPPSISAERPDKPGQGAPQEASQDGTQGADPVVAEKEEAAARA